LRNDKLNLPGRDKKIKKETNLLRHCLVEGRFLFIDKIRATNLFLEKDTEVI